MVSLRHEISRRTDLKRLEERSLFARRSVDATSDWDFRRRLRSTSKMALLYSQRNILRLRMWCRDGCSVVLQLLGLGLNCLLLSLPLFSGILKTQLFMRSFTQTLSSKRSVLILHPGSLKPLRLATKNTILIFKNKKKTCKV